MKRFSLLIAVLALLLCAACQDPRNIITRNVWRLSPDCDEYTGEAISSPGFNDRAWMKVHHRTTVLQSYVDAGIVPDPHFSDNVLNIPDSLFCRDYWFRNSFNVKYDAPRQFLNIDGINWKAEVWLNSKYIGHVDGAFRHEQFDVTGILRSGRNVLAIKIIHNANYGETKPRTEYSTGLNGGILGADNPTMHPTIGWDWIPTLPGRNIGIYGDLWYKFSGDVTIDDSFVSTLIPLPDTTRAFVNAEVTLKNHSSESTGGMIYGRFGPLSFNRRVMLAPGARERVCFDSLLFESPRLWWPNGYGEPYLYDVAFEFIDSDGNCSDDVNFKSGVRQMEYELEDYTPVTEGIIPGGYPDRVKNKRLQMYVNGRRFIGFGGNWGYPELMLQYEESDYDIAVRYHKEMNFTMIRDWVGMTSERAFYDACDKYGIMVWQDFWLANPWDGPDPEDPEMFNETARRYIKRVRNHPCIALYVGRNEGYPPEVIDTCLRASVARLHPGLYYHPHSAADGFNGGGPYNLRPFSDYFHLYGHDEMHSERGMPAVMNFENLVRTIGVQAEPYSSLEHPNFMYAMHDYTLGSVQNSAQATETFNETIVKAFGEPKDACEFTALAQWVNYEGYRAMFEGRSEYRQGLLLWMSHPCWPSMVWQTYDWYFEPTAAFFGCKKACEPLHILYNRWKGDVEVVNYHAGYHGDLVASAEIMDMYGKLVWSRKLALSIDSDDTVPCFPVSVPDDITEVYYLKLSLAEPNGKLQSENTYVLGREEGNLKVLRELPEASLKGVCVKKGPGKFDVRLTNTGDVPALMLRLRVTDKDWLVTPVHYSDNYFHLMPGENRLLTVSFDPECCNGKPVIGVKGFNYSGRSLKIARGNGE